MFLNYRTPLFCLSLFFLLIGCSSREKKKPDCSRLKTGNFVYHSRGWNLSVKRYPGYQIEVNKHDSTFSKLAIDWISDCRYELRLIETTFNRPKKELDAMKAITLTVDILNVHEDYYVYQADAGILYPSVVDTMWVMK